MKCHEAKRHLDLFMDGELSVQENMKVLEHLNLCRDCSAVYEGEKALRGELRNRLGGVRAPEGLADRLLGKVASDPAPAVPFRRPWAPKLAAAAFFVGLVGMMIFTPPAVPAQALAEKMAERHDDSRAGFDHARKPDRECVCLKCCPDDLLGERVGSFFDRHGLDEVCHHPELEAMGYRFSGVAVWPHHGRKVFWSVLRAAEGRAITHGLVSSPVAMTGPMATVPCGRRVVFLKPRSDRAELTCVFIFDDAKQLEAFRSRASGR